MHLNCYFSFCDSGQDVILLADDKLSGADQTCRFVVFVCLFDVD